MLIRHQFFLAALLILWYYLNYFEGCRHWKSL